MVQLLAYHRGKTLDTFLNQFPYKEFEDDSEYYWDVIGSSRRNIPLVEARDENGNIVTSESGMIGANTAPFYLVFGEKWFAMGEVIVGNLNEVYPFRILEEPREEGANYCYKIEVMAGNSNGVPKRSGHYKPFLIDLKLLVIGQQGASKEKSCAA